jgi:hypothetical protein
MKDPNISRDRTFSPGRDEQDALKARSAMHDCVWYWVDNDENCDHAYFECIHCYTKMDYDPSIHDDPFPATLTTEHPPCTNYSHPLRTPRLKK